MKKMKQILTFLMVLILSIGCLSISSFAASNTGHSISVTYAILYVDSSYPIGYSFTTVENTTFVCQYKIPHSDTAYSNHTIAIKDIKEASVRNASKLQSGYSFVGWSKTASANPRIFSFSTSGPTSCNKGNTIYLVAKRPSVTYTLNFDANGGTNAPGKMSVSSTTGSASFTIPATAPVKSGYTFKGWGTSASAAVASYQPGNTYTTSSSSSTLYAVWEKNYTLSFDANGGANVPDNMSVSSGSGSANFVIPEIVPVKDGYTFKGWDTSASATAASYQPGDTYTTNESSSVLYAVWEQNVAKYTITYQYPGNIKEKEVAEGSSITLPGAEEFYEGVYDRQNVWQLIGWEDQYGYIYAIGSDIAVTGNLVLKPATTKVMLLCDGATEDVIGILAEDEYEKGKNSEIANGLSYNMATTFDVLPGGDKSFVVDGTRKITQQTEDEYEEAFAGWFYTPYENQLPYELDWSADNNVGEDDLFKSDRVVDNRIYAYWIDADFLNTTIGYRTDDKCASKVYANSTVPGDIFRNYGFVLSTTAGENDENQLVIGGKIGAKPVGNFQKTAIYQKFKASPIYNKNYTAKEFNGGISGFDNNGSGNGYITYFYWKNMQLYDGIGNFTSLAARAYYTTLEGTVVYGDMTRVVFAANTVYPEGK